MIRSTRLRVDLGWVACLVLIAAFGLWPYRELFDQLPWGADATKWIAGASLDNPGWWAWCTGRKHFVGYRPITAFTFLLDHALFGIAARGYRGTDLLLHATGAGLLYALWRSLTGDRGPAGLVPVLLLLVHPATEEVVPYVARRSYLLANVFALGALGATLALARSERRLPPSAAIVALATGLAVLSNEVAFVILPLLPLLVLHAAPRERWGPRLAALLPTLGLAAAAIVARHQVLGSWGGGYAKRYFAYVRDGKAVWTELHSWEPGRIASACWSYLLDPTSPAGLPALFEGPARWVALAMVGAWLVWRAVLRPLRRRADPQARLEALLGLWLVGATGIVVLSQTWFWRQAFTLLPPLGLLLGLGLRDAATALSQRRWTGLPGLFAAATLLSAAAFTGPVVHGMDQSVHTLRRNGDPVARRVRDAIADLEGPGTVWLVVPVRGTTAQIVRLWGDRYGAARDLSFRVLAQQSDRATSDDVRVRLEDPERPTLVLERGLTFSATTVPAALRKRDRLEIDRLHKRGRRSYVLVLEPRRPARLWPVPRPPAGVEVEEWREEPASPDDPELEEP